MKLDDLTLGEIRQIKSLFEDKQLNCSSNISRDLIDKYVLIRTYSAGVHIGFLKQHEGTQVELSDCQRIYLWKGAFTLSEISRGIFTEVRLSEKIEKILLTEAIEIIPFTKEGEFKIRKVPHYVP